MANPHAFLVQAPIEFQQQGIEQVTLDEYNIHKRIKELDRRLFVYLHPFGGEDEYGNPEPRWQVYRAAESLDERPYLLMTLEEKSGAFRPLDPRVLHDLREGDLHASHNTYKEFLKRRKEREESRQREWEHLSQELAKDTARALAIDGQIHSPQVSMYVSDRERRKSGRKTR